MSDHVDATLSERRGTHGEFSENARIAQALKDVMRDSEGWERLTPSEREALEMIVHKVGRILTGDPHFPDHWHDVAGYARLFRGHGD